MSAHSVAPYERTTNAEALADAGRLGAKKRHSTPTYARSIGRRWEDLSEDERTETCEILSPIADDLIAILVRTAPPLSEGTVSQLRALLASTSDGGARAGG